MTLFQTTWLSASNKGRLVMDIADLLRQSGALGTMSRELGIDEATAARGACALLPAILGGFKNSARAQPSGLEGLVGMLGGMGGGGLLDAVLAPAATPVERGNDLLGQIFGSKDISRAVAGQAAQSTGIDVSVLKKMLPILAMLVAGYMAKQGGATAGANDGNGGLGGGLGGMLGQVLGGVLGSGRTAAPAAPAGGLGGLAAMLDLDGDGNPLDDIIGMAGKLGGR
jgi:hypothetical protein